MTLNRPRVLVTVEMYAQTRAERLELLETFSLNVPNAYADPASRPALVFAPHTPDNTRTVLNLTDLSVECMAQAQTALKAQSADVCAYTAVGGATHIGSGDEDQGLGIVVIADNVGYLRLGFVGPFFDTMSRADATKLYQDLLQDIGVVVPRPSVVNVPLLAGTIESILTAVLDTTSVRH